MTSRDPIQAFHTETKQIHVSAGRTKKAYRHTLARTQSVIRRQCVNLQAGIESQAMQIVIQGEKNNQGKEGN